jgi:hypothetical protein
MPTIRKAVSTDFERVYPLLQGFEGSPISKELWRKLFVSPWKTPEDFCGYLLLKDDEVKGFLGLIFSYRIINGRAEKLCNMTSWIVREECRGESLLMLMEVLKLRDYTLTNFTASPTVATILSKLGFSEFPIDQLVLLPVPSIAWPGRGPRCVFDLRAMRSKLSGENLRIFDDHQGLNCQHLLFCSDDGDCYVVLKKTRRKGLSFAKVHYLSNARVFREGMNRLTARICLRLGVFGVMVDERYVAGNILRAAAKYPHQRKGYFKSDSIVDENLIDTIYSELVILHD